MQVDQARSVKIFGNKIGIKPVSNIIKLVPNIENHICITV